MADVFHLPRIGDAMTEGELVEWLVAVGDTVDLDQTICSIETDKSVVEMTTPFRGTVLRLGGAIGDVIEVGAPLIVVGQPDETLPTPAATVPVPPAAVASPAATAPVGPVVSPLIRRLIESTNVDPARIVGTGAGGRITRGDVLAAAEGMGSIPALASPTRAMPKVRKAARERSLDLSTLTGSGPNGAITLEDLTGSPERGERREPMSATRRSIAAHLSESTRTIPQFTSMVDVDVSGLLATRAALAERAGSPVPIDALFVALLAPVLDDHPLMNAKLDGDDIVYFDRYDIGLAVDTADGLMLPVIRNVAGHSIDSLAVEIVRLATAARERRIAPSDLTGATCTVNNVGAVGITAGTPILPLGTSTIIAFGRTRPVVQLRDGNAVEVPTMTLSATFDHRLVDGGAAGRFLQQLKTHLEVPALGVL